MSEPLTLALAGGAGVALGTAFFGALWWTVRRSLESQRPALWLLGSLLLRMSLLLAGLYLVADGQWQRLLAGVIGVIGARFLVIRLTAQQPTEPRLMQEDRHAPEP